MKHTISKKQLLLLGLCLLGLAVRLYRVASLPGGLNQDEAYAGYEAWSLLHYHMDSHGYAFPVYFVSWGSGMNVLYSYLSIPFVALLGPTALAIRLPQVLFGTLTIPVAYGLGEEACPGKSLSLVFAGLVTISPWHIMMSRWGLESNLVIFFLAAGLLFFLRGLRDDRQLILSALFYGLSLYCYSAIWLILPLTLLLQVGLALYCEKFSLSRATLLAVLLLGILALPLLLFLAVNYQLIPEIRTPFLSIPQLVYLRQEYSLDNIPEKAAHLFQILLTQNDYNYNSAQVGGLYYRFSLPFILIGLALSLRDLVVDLRHRQFSPSVCLLAQALATLLISLLISNTNVNRINPIHIPILFFCAYGVWALGRLHVLAGVALTILYTVAFGFFCRFYFTQYEPPFYYGYTEALEQGLQENQSGSDLYLQNIPWPNYLLQSQTPTTDFVANVEWNNWPSAWMDVRSLGSVHFIFNTDPDSLDENGVYVFSVGNQSLADALSAAGFTGKQYESYYIFRKDR